MSTGVSSKWKVFLSSSIVKKQIMGITGLMLCGFLVVHLIGNTLIFISGELFNKYGHALISNPFIYVAEAILAAIFLGHIGLALNLTITNRKARPERYSMKQVTGRGSSFASATMPITGLLVLIFLIIHLINFKFGEVYMVTYDGVEMRDLYKLLIIFFQSPIAIIYYIFSVVALGIHVSHGFWSAFQSLGLNHPKYNGMIRTASKLFAIAITLGYSALPIFCYLQGVN